MINHNIVPDILHEFVLTYAIMQQQLPVYSLTETSCIMQHPQLPQARTMLTVTLLSPHTNKAPDHARKYARTSQASVVLSETLDVWKPLTIVIRIYSFEARGRGNVFTGRVFELAPPPPRADAPCHWCRAYT